MILAALLLAAITQPPSPCEAHHPATVIRVLDGDTYVLRVELEFDVSVLVSIRLEGLDTPERRSPGGPEATHAAEALLASGPVRVEPTARSFSRWVARVCVGTASLADLLRAAGHEKKG